MKKPKSKYLIESQPELIGPVEITRGYTYKMNVGDFESRDFFCSQKAACHPDDEEAVADRIQAFCRRQALKAAKDYMADKEAAEIEVASRKIFKVGRK